MTQPEDRDSTSPYAQRQDSPTQDPEPQYSEPQYSEPQHTEPQYGAPEYPDPQHTEPQYGGPPQNTGYPAPTTSQPGYSQPDFPQPGFPQPAPGGYPSPGYPPAGYPQAGYPPPGYPAPYGYPGLRGPVRPGGATASAVLMFIQGAIVLISTLYVLFFASLAGGASSAGLGGADSLQTELTIIGILQLVSVGLLIFGGVQLLGGSGRLVTIIATSAQLALVLYWMIRIGSLPDFDSTGEGGFFFVVPLFYAVLPLVALPLAMGKGVGGYILAKKGASAGNS